LMLWAHGNITEVRLIVSAEQGESSTSLVRRATETGDALHATLNLTTPTPAVVLRSYLENLMAVGLPPEDQTREKFTSCNHGWGSEYSTSFQARGQIFGPRNVTGRDWVGPVLEAWAHMEAVVPDVPSQHNMNYIQLDATNGHVEATAPTDTPYPWRTASHGITMQTHWSWAQNAKELLHGNHSTRTAYVAASRFTPQLLQRTIAPDAAAYINYLDLDPPLPAGIDRAKSYFGANVQRMAAIMHAYDPEWTFTYGNTVFERLTTYNTYGSSAGCASTPAQPHSEAEFAVLIAVASVLGVMVLGGMGLWRLVRLREQNEKLLQSGLQHADESRKSKALELHNLSRRVSRKGSLQSALGEIHEKSEKL